MKADGRLVAQGVKTCIQLDLIFSVSHSSHLKTCITLRWVLFYSSSMLSGSEGRECIVKVLSAGPRAMDGAGSGSVQLK